MSPISEIAKPEIAKPEISKHCRADRIAVAQAFFQSAKVTTRLAAVLLLSLPTWAGAGAYKGIDADGRVIYSDQPLPNAEQIALPARPSGEDKPENNTQDGAILGPYQQFEVLAPASGATQDSVDGKVQVSLMLDPQLEPDHKLSVQVDGTPVAGLDGRTQFVLQGLPPGSHQLQAEILDASGAAVARTALVFFNLRASAGPETSD
ncbi:DUF4124 domain-containing protein [Thiorhodovibrio frisius]|uniref:DUF4124 domain-containing protein n=1 Tax=Thiorhodovibrio frisius TaxID=631362 RepID=H8YZG6_9GAMM|nr:DUF4124 domain-containing protein [Thiorhodovibrio frisius]EIC22093.1 hypothetical protein Thi970DRAFT_02341 [Thiorhodovibrio frisius]WPL24386.1 hypothetical protein Thiofri_04605 [Thiorhodovibrio frisius]